MTLLRILDEHSVQMCKECDYQIQTAVLFNHLGIVGNMNI